MADINELISKQALDSISKLEKDLEKVAGGLNAVFEAAKQANEALMKIKPTELDKIAKVQKESASNAAKLTKEEQKLLEVKKKQAAEQEKVKKQAAEAIKAEKERLSAMAALDKQRQKALEQLAKLEAAEREAIDIMTSEARSIADLRKQNSLLRKERDQLDTTTVEGAAAIAKLNEQINLNEEAIRSNLDAAGQQRANIGNYKEDVKAALAETGFFSEQINKLNQVKRVFTILTKGSAAATEADTVATRAQAAATGTAATSANIFSKALKFLKVALISTGIGAIVIALGSLAAYFLKTEEGANKFQKALNYVRVLVKNTFDVAMSLGGALASLFTGNFAEAGRKFNNALSETKTLMADTRKEIELANKVIEDKEELEDVEIANIRVIADLERDVARLRLKSTELRDKDAKAALAATDEAINKENALMALRENEFRRRYEIAQSERMLVNEQSAEYDDKRRAESEAYAALIRQQEENAMALRKLYKERNTFEKELQDEAVKHIEEANKKIVGLTAEMYSKTAELTWQNALGREATDEEVLERKIEVLKKEVAESQASEKVKQEAISAIELNAEAERAAIRLKRAQEARELAREEADFLLELEQELIDEIEKELEDEVKTFEKNEEAKRKAAEDTAKERLELEKEIQKAAVDLAKDAVNAIFTLNARADEAEVTRLEQRLERKEISEEQFDAKVKAIRQRQAKRDKAQALLNATIGTAEAVVRALATPGPPGLQFILAALVGAAGAIQIGLIASEPLPAFAGGTESSPEGFARVAERGREMLIDPSGTLSLTGRKEEVRYLKAGTKVIPNRETEEILKGGTRNGSTNDEVIRRLNSMRSITIQPSKAKITERQGNYFREYRNAKIG